MHFRYLFLILFIYLSVQLHAQDVPEIIKRNLEATAESNGLDETGIKELEYDLEQFKRRPINLNKASARDLIKLHLLTDIQINAFINYRNNLGALISIYELQAIPGWDIITIQALLPYITIGTVNTTGDEEIKNKQSLKIELYRTIELSKGYNTAVTNHYLGDPYGTLINYTNRFSRNIQFGLSASKDPGEPFFKGVNKAGFDFYSFSFHMQNKGMLKNIWIGDYTVSLGQGLIYWQSLAFSKNTDITGIKKQGDVIGVYRSSNEFNFKRGLAFTIQKGHFEITQFVSYRKISGHLSSDTLDFFTSLLTNGYHRSVLESEQKNKVGLFSAGGSLTYNDRNLNISLNSAIDYFSKQFIKSAVPYNYYAFSGQDLFNTSISYGYTYVNMHAFGEYAVDRNLHPALIQGLLLSLSKDADVSLLYRHLPPSYQSVFGKAYTENTQPFNENGLNAGIVIKPVHTLKIGASVDYYKSPWLKYRVNTPSSGKNYTFQLQFVPSAAVELMINYREKATFYNSVDSTINYPQLNNSEHWIIGSNWKISRYSEIRYRVEMFTTQSLLSKSEGFLSYLEIQKKFSKRLQTDARIQYIESPDFTLYTYSNTHAISSLSALKGTGYYYYIRMKYNPLKDIEIQVVLDQTIYTDRSSIGSGNDQIPGNKKTGVRFQVHYII